MSKLLSFYHCSDYIAVLGEHDDLVMVDLEQQYWPYVWYPAWPPLAIWVHVILTLDKADTHSSSKTHAALSLLACKDHCCTLIAGMQSTHASKVLMLAWLL